MKSRLPMPKRGGSAFVGNNEFFVTARGARCAGTRRRYSDGAKVIDTKIGYCLLNAGEGADSESYAVIAAGETVSFMHAERWQNSMSEKG